jgi:hypothetical protein
LEYENKKATQLIVQTIETAVVAAGKRTKENEDALAFFRITLVLFY